MNKLAIFVDAGYFWVQTVDIVHGTPKPRPGRDSVRIDYSKLHEAMIAEAKSQFPGCDLLRVYWYDGPGTNQRAKTSTHLAIEGLDDFKLRLGTRNGAGDQKAVDGLIIADMIGLAQTRAISHALLVSGDADLTPGVIAAQGLGIRVHLLSLGSGNATSPYLKAEVDAKRFWADEQVKTFAAGSAQPVTSPTDVAEAIAEVVESAKAQAEAESVLQQTASSFVASLSELEKAELKGARSIPPAIDGRLLSAGRRALGRSLDDDERREIRARLKEKLAATAA